VILLKGIKVKGERDERLTRCMGDCPNINVICKGCSFPDYVEEYEEKEMEKQKFQFESEEQAIEFYKNVTLHNGIEDYLFSVKRNGYIRKSELQQMVDEAEEGYKNKYELSEEITLLESKLLKAIQALKKDHPEYKK